MKPPARVPTDTVQPLRFFDDTIIFRNLILYSMFVFDEVLDVDKLHGGLKRLVAREGWQKLGARMRRNGKGDLEYHIPAAFTLDRPGVAFTHIQHAVAIADHPLASRLPKPTNHLAVVGNPDEFTELAMGPGTPSKLSDYLLHDIPQLGLHVISFTDATIVVVHWPHSSFDAMGKHALLKASSLMVQGRDDEVQTPHGGGGGSEAVDPLGEKLGLHPPEEHVLAHRRLGMWGLVGYILRNLVSFGLKGREHRVLCIPGPFVKKLHAEALAERKAEGVEPAFLSESDVLTAWWIKLTLSHLPQDSEQTIAFQVACDCREVLKGDILPVSDGRPYISNAITLLWTIVPAKDILNKPISATAALIRRSIIEQRTRGQVEAYYAVMRASPKHKPMPIFGEVSMYMQSYSNWAKADLFGLDFGAAVYDGDRDTQRQVRPRYVQNLQMPMSFPEGFFLLGKDTSGNFWWSGYRVQGQWALVEKALEAELQV
ncbi:hypothetical protein GQ53DRAFT_723912 [Thozetella sp. PMI_491]|nr:hypothetical protein GQ53DRAFT_723912 [Thozetella sp. PMI_491]